MLKEEEIFSVLDAEAENPATCQVYVQCYSRGLGLQFPGYGDKTSEEDAGEPVFVEFRNGIPHLIVWADINSEEPTHVISLEGAMESKRADD